jgi:RND family efflux transporter MFP subunit
VKGIFTLSFILAGLVGGYLLVSASIRDRLSELFALDYEIPVEVRKAEKSTFGPTLTARGELEPLKEVRVGATIPGVIKEIRFAAGDKVATGALVAVVEAKDLDERLAVQQVAIKEAEAHLKRTESQLAAAEKQLADLRDLYRKDFIARHEVEEAEAAAKTARAQIDAARAQLAQRTSVSAQTRHVLGLAQITAPFAGVITRRWSEPGDNVSDAEPVFSIAAADIVKIMVKLRTMDAVKILPRIPVKVNVDALPGRDFQGSVSQVEDTANFAGDELSVKIELANAGGALKFGMPATVSFSTGERRDGIFVPKSALIEIQGKPVVYINEGGRARRRNVTPGKQHDGDIEIESGLEPGDVVVTRGVERLGDGSRVRVAD